MHEFDELAARGYTQTKIADKLGIPKTSLYRIRYVWKTAHMSNVPEERELAKQLIREFDLKFNPGEIFSTLKTAQASGSFDNKLKSHRAKSPRMSVAEQQRVIENTIYTLSGTALGIDQIGDISPDLPKDKAVEWIDELVENRRIIQKLIQNLRRHVNEQQI